MTVIVLVLCWLVLAAAIITHIQSVRWIRSLAKVDTEMSQEMRLIIHDLIARDPQLEEPLELALCKLDNWERRLDWVRRASFMRSARRSS